MTAPPIEVVRLLHLIALSLWGGVVATEAVIEVLPFRQPDLHEAAVRQHFWIDLLVELPLVIAVCASGGVLLFLLDDITGAHIVKLIFAGIAVSVNLYCIFVVLRRARQFGAAPAAAIWSRSKKVIACFAIGLAAASIAVVLGFRLALSHLH